MYRSHMYIVVYLVRSSQRRSSVPGVEWLSCPETMRVAYYIICLVQPLRARCLFSQPLKTLRPLLFSQPLKRLRPVCTYYFEFEIEISPPVTVFKRVFTFVKYLRYSFTFTF